VLGGFASPGALICFHSQDKAANGLWRPAGTSRASAGPVDVAGYFDEVASSAYDGARGAPTCDVGGRGFEPRRPRLAVAPSILPVCAADNCCRAADTGLAVAVTVKVDGAARSIAVRASVPLPSRAGRLGGMELILRVYLVYCEGASGTMTYFAALANRRSIGKRMGGCRGSYVAPYTRGGSRLHRVYEALRIQHILEAG
jgi:hypothetical protein